MRIPTSGIPVGQLPKQSPKASDLKGKVAQANFSEMTERLGILSSRIMGDLKTLKILLRVYGEENNVDVSRDTEMSNNAMSCAGEARQRINKIHYELGGSEYYGYRYEGADSVYNSSRRLIWEKADEIRTKTINLAEGLSNLRSSLPDTSTYQDCRNWIYYALQNVGESPYGDNIRRWIGDIREKYQ